MARHIAMPLYHHEQPDEEPPLCYLGRRVDNDDRYPKYKWGAKGFEKTKVLYGLREALQTEADTLIVVEGAFDVFACHGAGFGQACAPIGVDLSDDQVTLLVKSGRKIVLMFDGDSSGLAAMRAAAAKLLHRRGLYLSCVFLPENKDPADLSLSELRELLNFVPVTEEICHEYGS
jgi:DNA primase